MAGIVYVSFDKLEKFMTDAFIKAGVPSDDAGICAEVLIDADKRGIDSHGTGRLKPIYLDRIKAGLQSPVTKIEVIKETPATMVIDGNNGMGQVIAKKAMQYAIEKAEKCGLGMTAVRNSTHYGFAGYYAIMATKKDMIGITGTNARPSIAPTFGIENMLGTNPLVFGMPTDEDFPFTIDCATSITQRGKIEQYQREGRTLPEGWVIDSEGRTGTDPDIVLKGLDDGSCALAPLGGIGEELAGYKGYGYATVVEILSSALQGGLFLKSLSDIDSSGKRVKSRLGHFFIAINIECFTEPSDFKKTTGSILRQLRASKKAPGQQRIYTAGEKEYLAWIERKDKGVPLNEALQKVLIKIREEYGLWQYKFNF
ncbi:MAG: putative oxidoreductase YjmC [Actinobacteria bacterium ADurb.Bin346]|nr:MAG: putative oxidoreductase YjmC [Actinobacteria bacterium ADurb.Bin346]